MGIFSRLGDMINTNLTALLDKADDPIRMVQNIIQEMENTLVEVRTQAAKTIADKKLLQRHWQQVQQQQHDWQVKAELALQKNREDLAKMALLEKINLEQLAEELLQQQQAIDVELQKHHADMATLQAKLQEALQRKHNLLRRQDSAISQSRAREQHGTTREAVFHQQMENLERKIETLESLVEAHELSEKTNLQQEIDGLALNDRIERELNNLKLKQGGSQ